MGEEPKDVIGLDWRRVVHPPDHARPGWGGGGYKPAQDRGGGEAAGGKMQHGGHSSL